MKSGLVIIIVSFITIFVLVISHKLWTGKYDMNIIFLHHSTGDIIWKGNMGSVATKVNLPILFKKYNKENGKKYIINEMIFPKEKPYGWHNYPFDYYNIWVKNAGEKPFMEEPTLEILTKKFQVIIFKHCFPVSNILKDRDIADINSNLQTISNYKLQYSALRNKLHTFPNTKFILFTGAALVQSSVSEEEAIRTKEFFRWVTDEWDLQGDNIYIWDLYSLQTEGSLYFKDEYAVSQTNSHPNKNFAGRAVVLLFNRIIDIIDNNGIKTQLTGEEN